ncbi:MAG: alpha-glucan family phosphorylase [Gemmatimonadaceae bacterium]|nr:alpha-glucan family phosphorylase [Gemmatimonadaceae bacterium]
MPNTTLPSRLAGLRALAGNLSWSWNREARALFAAIDDRLWHRVRHNPIDFLNQVDPARLEACATDPVFRAQYDEAMHWLQAESSNAQTWFATHHPELAGRTIAYFCAEFGLHNSVPIYSGGLGVLAGDHCKTASDLGLPFVGVGILYRNGYFDQKVAPDGWQQDSADALTLARTPITPIVLPDGAPCIVTVKLDGHDTFVRAWQLMVGRVPVILLDTDLPENRPEARELLSRLYSGGVEMRLRQEWLLGVGGVRVLRKLGIAPHVWHANEGHASFMYIERAREYIAGGMTFAEAVKAVRRESVFTTHTPVPAGHDVFARERVEAVAGPVWLDMGIDADTFASIGFHPEHGPSAFHMTACAVRMSSRVTGVSKLHAEVTREMLRPMWPNRPANSVPVGHVTNGVHLATWMANPIMKLLDRHLGNGWGFQLDDPAVWDRILTLPDDELWAAHRELKDVLFDVMKVQARRSFAQQEMTAAQIVGAGLLLDRHTLTIGFARRFATYKRADLLFHDPERLMRILGDADRPVQLIFAGKAHPADTPGKTVLQKVYQATRDPRFEGRVAFLEDYDMHIAHLLVQGVDLWMNVPRVPLEASGTSGMKAALNGVPQLSTIDGWWAEGYDGTNGWAVTGGGSADTVREDAEQAARIYELLEKEIVPRYYDRPSRTAEPKAWLATMKHAIRVAGRIFTAQRMVMEYTKAYYVPAMAGGDLPDDPPTA